MTGAHVVSVNVGGVREVMHGGTLVRTGIWKSSIGDQPVLVEGVNLQGDDQADRRVHGGADKAVYAYALEDHAYWEREEGFAVEPGRFGENLTTQGVDLRVVRVGERWKIGSTVLEVAQPRMPCYKLGIRMDDAHFPRRFLAAGRLGAYLRIIQPGHLRAGDVIEVDHRPTHDVTLDVARRALTDPSTAVSVLAVAAVAPSWRAMIRRHHYPDES